MFNRATLLRGATALLYLGPLLAGLAGLGWSLVPIFTLIFLLWLLVLRPETWPEQDREWLAPRPWIALAARTVVQLLLVLLCFGFGRGIGHVLGFEPKVPFWLPVSLSAVAILLGRLVWNPANRSEMDAFLDDALRQMTAMPLADRPRSDWPGRFAPLLDLGEDTPDFRMEEALIEAIGTEDSGGNLRLLARHLRFSEKEQAVLRRAIVRLATDPAMADLLKGTSGVTEAFFIASQDPQLLDEFLSRAEALFEDRPDLWDDYPAADSLRIAADSVPDAALGERLRGFAKVIEVSDPDNAVL
ncbi:hypothetical protein L0V05_01545 [Tabrizicola sp. J26]|uniref:hypothetical protein n=1 Tax=Alitabrizicola rongguiensis TaxID=2909234 RepID=UPI001F31AA19|nr:hypothetical protein [Tabrizicola rongguiensis]MCF1707492.1 hypothetical protein [Tabrizicola rongguiensis]